MKNDWATTYREGCIASEARSIVGNLWIEAEPFSDAESVLQRVDTYLHDRCMIDLEFSMIRTKQ